MKNNNNNDIFIICIESIHNTRVNYIFHRFIDIINSEDELIYYVAFLIYCSFLSYCLQLVSYPYFITDCLFIFSEVEFFYLSL